MTGRRLVEKQMIVVHHLNDSRSQRILWLLEELAPDLTKASDVQRDADDAGAGR